MLWTLGRENCGCGNPQEIGNMKHPCLCFRSLEVNNVNSFFSVSIATVDFTKKVTNAKGCPVFAFSRRTMVWFPFRTRLHFKIKKTETTIPTSWNLANLEWCFFAVVSSVWGCSKDHVGTITWFTLQISYSHWDRGSQKNRSHRSKLQSPAQGCSCLRGYAFYLNLCSFHCEMHI